MMLRAISRIRPLCPEKRIALLRGHVRGVLLIGVLALLWGQPPAGEAATRSPHRKVERGCTECHTTSGWKEIVFDHGQTRFDLEGRHAEQACLDCHGVEDFNAATASCLTCHADYHQGCLGDDCGSCHGFAGWRPAIFDHELTAFPLWGAHGAVDCVQCHVNEVTFQFAEELQTCFDCHERDFGRARVAVHLTAGPDCETCHTLDTWQGGHDPAWFEIRSGHHEAACRRCHKRQEEYASYTCADCHRFPLKVEEHRELDVQDARCLECHPHGFH